MSFISVRWLIVRLQCPRISNRYCYNYDVRRQKIELVILRLGCW